MCQVVQQKGHHFHIGSGFSCHHSDKRLSSEIFVSTSKKVYSFGELASDFKDFFLSIIRITRCSYLYEKKIKKLITDIKIFPSGNIKVQDLIEIQVKEKREGLTFDMIFYNLTFSKFSSITHILNKHVLGACSQRNEQSYAQ